MPYEDTIDPGDFRSWTLDTWNFGPESARRVGHPAPFPLELPRRVIELNTYKGDCVLDPFMGSGQTAIASLQTSRHYVGVDVDQSYVELARTRVSEASAQLEEASTRAEGAKAKKVAKPKVAKPKAGAPGARLVAMS